MGKQGSLINYRYDALDRLIGLEPRGATASTYMYCDGRVATQLKDNGHCSLIQAGGHWLAQTARSGDTIVSTLLGTDHKRSVLQSVTANETQHGAYTPYGGRPDTEAIAGLPGFNGELPDPVTGCYLLGNGYRAYNPSLMRFHSPDSMSPFESGGINPYAYCQGDPINMSDPTGHFSWRSILSIAIAATAIAIGAVTLGSGVPLTGLAIFVAVADIGSNTLSIASTLASELAPETSAGSVLGLLSLGLAAGSFAAAHLPKFVFSERTRAAARFQVAGPVSLTRQGAVRVTNGQAPGKLSAMARLGKGARNTVALENRLKQINHGFDYVKYGGYLVKGEDFVTKNLLPYFSASGDEAGQPASTLDAFVRGDGPRGLNTELNMKVSDFLSRDQDLARSIRGA